MVRGRLLLAALVGLTAFPGQIFKIAPIGHAKIREQPRDGFRLIGFELAKKKFLEGHPAELGQSALRLRE